MNVISLLAKIATMRLSICNVHVDVFTCSQI